MQTPSTAGACGDTMQNCVVTVDTIVHTDGTITGDGSLGAPLHVANPGDDTIELINNEPTSLVIGTPVYINAPGGVKKAQADVSSTSLVLGFVAQISITSTIAGAIQVDGILDLTTAQWDVITGDVGGLVNGATYYLDPTIAGRLTTTIPNILGQSIEICILGLSPTQGKIILEPPILL